MNALQQFIQGYMDSSECEAMNALQDQRIISDNCIHADSVGNAGEAIQWLHQNARLFAWKKKPKTL